MEPCRSEDNLRARLLTVLLGGWRGQIALKRVFWLYSMLLAPLLVAGSLLALVGVFYLTKGPSLGASASITGYWVREISTWIYRSISLGCLVWCTVAVWRSGSAGSVTLLTRWSSRLVMLTLLLAPAALAAIRTFG